MSTRDEYLAKFKDPRWQKLRLEVFQRDDYTCQACYDTENTLHVHHTYYIYGNDPWDYPLDCFVTLCENCHEVESEEIKGAKQRLLRAVGKHFLAFDMDRLSRGFEAYERPHVREVTASFLEWLLTEKPLQDELWAAWWEHNRKQAAMAKQQ